MIGEGPGSSEEIFNEPFIGESGRLIDKINTRVGGNRASLHITNAMLCKPGRKLSPDEWRKAIECCKPRLASELSQLKIKHKIALALGARAQQALTGKAKIMEWMGAPLQGVDEFADWIVLSTLHPAFVLRGKPEYEPVVARHVQRAWQLARGELPAWAWPDIIVGYGPEVIAGLRRLLHTKKLACDVETSGLDPKSSLLNVGFGSRELNLAVSIDWQMAGKEEKRLARRILESEAIIKVFHNGAFDVTVLENN